MCGIAGIWNVAIDEPVIAVDAMLDAMRHRGPDGRGLLEFTGGAAGMVRLALVDLSPRGQQPLWSQDRQVGILFNGEIYNFREERERLKSRDFHFRTGTDTEVILNLYLERGLEFVQRLRGMYALAIFDWRKSKPGGLPMLVLARGPLGIKPLYLAHPHGDLSQVVFSSEVRALVASGLVAPKVSQEGLADYLTHGFLMQPQTILEGVRMLEPGSLESYIPGQPVRRWQFWQMPDFAPRQETLDEAADRLRSTLEESVRLHAMADAPVGAFQSGGIDSTGVVGLMRKHIPNLHTYTLRFPDSPGQDEATEAAEAARKFDCKNTIVDIHSDEIPELLCQFVATIDQPSCDGFNTWLVSRAAARDVKAVLSGLGGDEWFAGYPVTRRMANYTTTSLGRTQALAGRIAASVVRAIPSNKLRRRIENISTRKSSLATWIQSHTVFRYEQARRAVGLPPYKPSQDARFAQLLDQINANWRTESAIGLSCLLDTRVYMNNQLLRDSDATSMAHSLELRVPLVDLQIVAFARTCQDSYKLRGDGGSSLQYGSSGAKRVLIHALRDVLPPTIANRPKKGFSLPMVSWLQGPLWPLVEDTTSPQTFARRGLVDPSLAARVTGDAKAGIKDVFYPQLWSLMILELWCRSLLDKPRQTHSPQLDTLRSQR